MKVLYDHQIFAAQVHGGISRYFCEIGTRVSNIPDIDANVLCPLYVNNYLRAQHSLKVWGRHVQQIPSSVLAMRLANAAMAPIFRQLRKGTQIYHETYFSRFDLAPHGAARVVTVHDMIHEKFPRYFPLLDRTRGAKQTALRRADHIICVSENTRRDLLETLDLDERKISVVPHGSSLHWREPGQTQRKPQLLYVGARSYYKNFTSLVRAFGLSRLPRDGFSLVCFGGGSFTTAERTLFAELGLQKSVTHRNGDDSVLMQLFRESTALVYPSLYEGFGIPPLEAMSCGCPVACSNSSSLPEVVGQAAELFDPRDIDAIILAVESVALSPTRGTELIAAGYDQASRFSWDLSAASTCSIYRRLA